jgi:hypothetical protein
MMDFVAHVHAQLARDGYRGVPITALYRDEVCAAITPMQGARAVGWCWHAFAHPTLTPDSSNHPCL